MTPQATAAGIAPSLRVWRVTTAARAFALATVTGLVISADSFDAYALPVVALFILGAASSALDLGVSGRAAPWIPVVEGVLAAAVLSTSMTASSPMLLYLAIPPVVAGLRRGWVTTFNAFLATGAALVAAQAPSVGGGATTRTVATDAVAWLMVGLGAGLLASWQTRSVRLLEANQAPYTEAHRAMSHLLELARAGRVGFDSMTSASEMGLSLRAEAGADRSAVFLVDEGGGLEVLSSHGRADGLREIAEGRGRDRNSRLRRFPLRVNDHEFGVLVLGRSSSWPPELLSRLQAVVDAWALRLETSLLFDAVRAIATMEERNRLAREIHDGVAQELVALGYLVDEIESISVEPEVRATASRMREEVTRLVGELRFSIFDLRHDMRSQRLSGALAEYVREVTRGTGLRVHLTFDESDIQLPRRTESELLRISQEAIGNVRRHAGASNLWVTLVSDGSSVRLAIEDDGVGNACPRDRHWGLQSMRERAETVGGDFTVSDRADGGTVVRLQIPGPDVKEAQRDHHRTARR